MFSRKTILISTMTSKLIFSITVLFFLSSCVTQAGLEKAKTEIAADLRTDTKASKTQIDELKKRLDMLEANVKGTVDLQKNVADTGVKFDQLTTDIQILQGKIEENNFRLSELAQKLDDKSYKISELAAKVEELEAKVKSLTEGTPTPSADKGKKSEAKTPEPSEAYRQAKTDYDKGNFDLAVAGFQNYIKQFPDASQADSAQYWIGESYYSKKDFVKAIEAFSKLLKAYPKSEKAPAAQLKIGLSYLSEKNPAKAKEHLNKVIKDYPKTKEAEIAKERLNRIGK